MKIQRKNIIVESKKQMDFLDITHEVQEIVDASGIREGQVLVYAPHTTMGVTVNHNEKMLLQDLAKVLYNLIPAENQYAHDLFEIGRSRKSDGRSNGHSHCKSFVLGVSETLPVEKGKVMITDKQNIFAVDFDGPRKRDIIIQVMGL